MTTPNTTEEEKRMKKRKPTQFDHGYICACADIIRTHGEPTIARDVLKGVAPANLDWSKANDLDVKVLFEAGLIDVSKGVE